MPLQTVEPTRLYRQIAEQLRALMASGEFEAGARLPAERDLAKQLGVSRPSVREALIALEVEGWVEVRTGSGVYVLDRRERDRLAEQAKQTKKANESQTALNEWGPLELIRARRVVEGETAAMAAVQAKCKDVSAMKDAIESMQQDAEHGVMPLDGDRAFHTAIVQACDNAVLIETVQGFWDSRRGPLFERLGNHFETLSSWQSAIAEHQAVLTAIKAHDAGAARSAMHAHMDNSHSRFSASWRRAKKT